MTSLLTSSECVAKPVEIGDVSRIETYFHAIVRIGRPVPLVQHISQVARKYGLSGKGLRAAVIDNGLYRDHKDFLGRLVAWRNFTNDDHSDPNNIRPAGAHGTQVTGLLAANGPHQGVAPDAELIVAKSLGASGRPSEQIRAALEWSLTGAKVWKPDVVCISMADNGNWTSEADVPDSDDIPVQAITSLLDKLAAQGIPCVISAGNSYHVNDPDQGMAYPAIVSSVISAGSLYANAFFQGKKINGTTVSRSEPGEITPYTQRLSRENDGATHTTVFAPVTGLFSTGRKTTYGRSKEIYGTSYASPVVAGVVLLLKEYCLRLHGVSPDTATIKQWLGAGPIDVTDSCDKCADVRPSGGEYRRLDLGKSLKAVEEHSF